jgi:predicted nucleic acid-binding protein
MILIYTSACIDFFRGRDPLARIVDDALSVNDAAVCGPVETELRRGLLNERERKRVLPLLSGCHWLSTPEDLWMEAGDLGFRLRRRGIACKTLDLLIATYALSHSAALLTSDKDFLLIQKAGVPLLLAPI